MLKKLAIICLCVKAENISFPGAGASEKQNAKNVTVNKVNFPAANPLTTVPKNPSNKSPTNSANFSVNPEQMQQNKVNNQLPFVAPKNSLTSVPKNPGNSSAFNSSFPAGTGGPSRDLQLYNKLPSLGSIVKVENISLQNIENNLKKVNPRDIKEAAILKGCLWLVVFGRDDKKLKSVFSDFLLMLDEMSRNHNFNWLKQFAWDYKKYLIRSYLLEFDSLFDSDESLDFLGISLIILEIYPELINFLLPFYQDKFIYNAKKQDKNFATALAAYDFDKLTDFLVEHSILNLCHKNNLGRFFYLPENKFPEMLQKIRNIDFKKRPKESFSEKMYFLTHVILSLISYGRNVLVEDKFTAKLKELFLKNLTKVKKENDIDLLAEVAYCLKLYKNKTTEDNEILRDLEKTILTSQNSDGSWGDSFDKNSKAYDILHPTWTALTFLSYYN